MHLHLASRHLKHHVIFPVQRVAGNAAACRARDIGGAALVADDAAVVGAGLADHPCAVSSLAVIIEKILDQRQGIALDHTGHVHTELAAQIAEPVLENAVGDAVACKEIGKVQRRLPVGENRHIAPRAGGKPGQQAKRHHRSHQISSDPPDPPRGFRPGLIAHVRLPSVSGTTRSRNRAESARIISTFSGAMRSSDRYIIPIRALPPSLSRLRIRKSQ